MMLERGPLLVAHLYPCSTPSPKIELRSEDRPVERGKRVARERSASRARTRTRAEREAHGEKDDSPPEDLSFSASMNPLEEPEAHRKPLPMFLFTSLRMASWAAAPTSTWACATQRIAAARARARAMRVALVVILLFVVVVVVVALVVASFAQRLD